MSWPWLMVLETGCGLAVVVSVLLCIHHWEFRRMVRSRMGFYRYKTDWNLPPASLLIPVKGDDVRMEENLAALFSQDYPDYEVVFVVEDESDPATEVIERLRNQYLEVPSRLIIAGLAERVGQKVHNLRVATRKLRPKTEVIAFVDADARPGPDWLREIVDRVQYERVGANTGYRWMTPEQQTLPNLLVCGANSVAMGLFGSHSHNLIWGGSWAIRRDLFEHVDMQQAWDGALTEDVVAAQVLKKMGHKIEFEPGSLCVSPLDMDWMTAVAFIRRQFFMVRIYAPTLWFCGFFFALIVTMGFWLSSALAVTLAWTGDGGVITPALFATWAVALYGLGALRIWLRRDAVRYCLGTEVEKSGNTRWFEFVAGPAIGVFTLVLMGTTMFSRSTVWRSIYYKLDANGRVKTLKRLEQSAATAGESERRIAA